MKKLLVLLILFTSINVSYGQEIDSVDFENFKKFLPYMLKGMNEASSKELDERTSGKFKKPWKIKALEKGKAEKILSKLVENRRFEIEKDYQGEWKLKFFSKLQDFETADEIYESNGLLSNVYIQISDIKILDEKGNSIYVTGQNKSVRNNESHELDFNSSQINTTFPINGNYKNVKGNITITMKEFSDIQYMEFDRNARNVIFNLGGYKGIELLKVEKNKAYFVLPTVIKGLQIVSTNKNNENFSMNMVANFPKKIYDFGVIKGRTDEDINKFIEELSMDEVYRKSKILIYETNGTIENLYIFKKSKQVELGTRTLEILLKDSSH